VTTRCDEQTGQSRGGRCSGADAEGKVGVMTPPPRSPSPDARRG
jgi:hypothetical protein